MMAVLGYIVLLLVSVGVVWWGSGVLERSSEQLAAYYELPAIVQGAVIAAIGSSFPELSTTVISTLLHGQFELGVSTIVGSAIFNILVIPAVAALAGDGAMQSNRDIVYKEAQFYMLSVAVLLLSFAFAVIYFPVPDGGMLLGTMNRWLAVIPVMLYGLYIFIQYQDSMDYEAERPEGIHVGKQWLFLGASLVTIALGVEGLVRSAIAFEALLGVPSFIWGITILAAGTSLPDLFVSVKASREGNAVTSMSNVLGSNVFDLLVAVPAGILIAGSAVINFSRAAPMMAVLTLATIFLFTFTRTDMEVDMWEAVTMLALYLVFVAWMVLETFGVTSLVL